MGLQTVVLLTSSAFSVTAMVCLSVRWRVRAQGICGNLRGFCCVRDGMWECIGKEWRPMRWRPPGTINRDSDDVWDNCWENKYWSCC